jgi:diguanylate cyclase (GGDEF)-like protein
LQNVEYVEQIEVIKQTANTDYLTNLPNRRHFFSQVSEVMHREPKSMTLGLIDLDHFKNINDTHGHDLGDIVLKETAKMMKKHFASDVISRFGGEEFCVFMHNIDAHKAAAKFDAFRQAMSDKVFKRRNKSIQCTLSIGITHQRSDKIEHLLTVADEYLYKAKANGRNCVVGDSGATPLR